MQVIHFSYLYQKLLSAHIYGKPVYLDHINMGRIAFICYLELFFQVKWPIAFGVLYEVLFCLLCFVFPFINISSHLFYLWPHKFCHPCLLILSLFLFIFLHFMPLQSLILAPNLLLNPRWVSSVLYLWMSYMEVKQHVPQ